MIVGTGEAPEEMNPHQLISELGATFIITLKATKPSLREAWTSMSVDAASDPRALQTLCWGAQDLHKAACGWHLTL